jgi:hypothetical protein
MGTLDLPHRTIADDAPTIPIRTGATMRTTRRTTGGTVEALRA